MAQLYRQKVTTLADALEHPEARTEAKALRGVIDAVMTPPERAIRIELKGKSRGDARRDRTKQEGPETGSPLAASIDGCGGGI